MLWVVAVFLFSCNESPKVKAKEPLKSVPLVREVPSPAGNHSALPFLFSNEKKTLLSWVEKESDTLTHLKFSELTNGEWQKPQKILSGKDWFVNWADFPMIAENEGSYWSHVLKKSTSGTYSYDVKMNVFPEGSSAWETNLPLHSDETPTEHGFVTALPYQKGFFITWLDGRNTEENTEGERGAMTLRAAEVSVKGAVTGEHELDRRTCDCCQTTAAITANGPVVIYRDRSDDEVRDISIVRLVEGEWTEPKAVHEDGWKIRGCPVNGPKAAAKANTLVVAWFTEAEENPRVQLAFSSDAGASFDPPIQMNRVKALGRVDVALIDSKTAVVSWMETQNKSTQLRAVKVSSDGTASAYHTITSLNASRKTGFPQLELVKDRIYFAWTELEGESTMVKTAYAELSAF